MSYVSYAVSCSDKLLLHAITLGLWINDFSLNISAMAQDIKMSDSSLVSLARELGCKIKKDYSAGSSGSGGSPLIAELTVPLTFPERRKPKGKK